MLVLRNKISVCSSWLHGSSQIQKPDAGSHRLHHITSVVVYFHLVADYSRRSHYLPNEMVPSPSHVLPGSDSPSTPTISQSCTQPVHHCSVLCMKLPSHAVKEKHVKANHKHRKKERQEKEKSRPFGNHNKSLQVEPEAVGCHANP